MSHSFWNILFSFYILFVLTTNAWKLLIVFPYPGLSHGILGQTYVEYLLKAGHEVTYITPFPIQEPSYNLHQVVVDYPNEILPRNDYKIKKVLENDKNITDFGTSFEMFHRLANCCLKSRNVQKLIEDSKQHFDLVIVEWLYTEIYAGLAALFRCPFVWSSSLEPHSLILKLVDEVPNPAYVPDTLSKNVPPFSFMQRVNGLWIQIKTYYYKTIVESRDELLYKEVFVGAAKKKSITLPSLEQLKYNASLVLSNSHSSIGEPVRLPRNFIEIAGYHVQTKPKTLPKDLQLIMDNARNGIVYFSMGTILRSSHFPQRMRTEFLQTFSHFNYTFIWKFEGNLFNIPKNVHIAQWLPQQSVLAHANCILFITHGGLLSVIEAIHYGVPIIGVPVVADQFANVDRAVYRGYARKVDLSYDTPKELKTAIEEILSNSSYRARAKQLSLIYHDRPVPPAKLLTHCVEHTIKTNGAPHLRSRALMTPWYQKMYLDLAAVAAGTATCFYYLVNYLYKRTKKRK